MKIKHLILLLLVVLALAIIFIPMRVDRTNLPSSEPTMQMPKIEGRQQGNKVSPLRYDEEPTDQQPAVQDKPAEKTKPATQQQAYTPTGWVVQVASFADQSKATALVSELRAGHFHAFAQQQGAVTRVFVGPDVSQQRLTAISQQLQQRLGLTTVITPYYPA